MIVPASLLLVLLVTLCIVHVYGTCAHYYALCGYTRHLRTCRYAAIHVNRPSGICQAAAIAVNRTKGIKKRCCVIHLFKIKWENLHRNKIILATMQVSMFLYVHN